MFKIAALTVAFFAYAPFAYAMLSQAAQMV
jgi:hypothetical protein